MKIFSQDHILAAMITTQKSLPCLQEMVANYLTEARLRFVLEEVVVDHNAGCRRFEKDR